MRQGKGGIETAGQPRILAGMVADLVWLLGVLTLGLLSPGPDFFVVLKNSLGGTRARALATVAGIVVGLALQCALLAGGFAAAPPAVLRAVQWAGAAFLAYLGLRALFARPAGEHAGAAALEPSRAGHEAVAAGQGAAGENSATSATDAADSPPAGARSAFAEGFLCNVTNPKAFLFFLSLYAQLVRPGGGLFWRVALPVAIVLHALVAWTLVALAVQSPPVSRQLRRAQRWLPRAFGAALLALAAWTAWAAARGV